MDKYREAEGLLRHHEQTAQTQEAAEAHELSRVVVQQEHGGGEQQGAQQQQQGSAEEQGREEQQEGAAEHEQRMGQQGQGAEVSEQQEQQERQEQAPYAWEEEQQKIAPAGAAAGGEEREEAQAPPPLQVCPLMHRPCATARRHASSMHCCTRSHTSLLCERCMRHRHSNGVALLQAQPLPARTPTHGI